MFAMEISGPSKEQFRRVGERVGVFRLQQRLLFSIPFPPDSVAVMRAGKIFAITKSPIWWLEEMQAKDERS